jgi:hypothetical protein
MESVPIKQSTTPKSSCRKSLIDIGSPRGRPRFGPISARLTKAAGSGGRAYVFPHGTTKWTIKAAAIMRIRKPVAATITVSRIKRLPKGTPAGGSKLDRGQHTGRGGSTPGTPGATNSKHTTFMPFRAP